MLPRSGEHRALVLEASYLCVLGLGDAPSWPPLYFNDALFLLVTVSGMFNSCAQD